MLRTATLLALAATTAAIGAPPAMAGISPATNLSARAGNIADLQAAASSDGFAATSYSQDGHVFVSTKQPGAAFAAPVDLGVGLTPQVAASASGRFVLAWSTTGSLLPRLHVALREPGAPGFTELDTTVVPSTVIRAHVGVDGTVYLGVANGTTGGVIAIPPGSTTYTVAMTFSTPGITDVAVGTPPGASPLVWALATSKNSTVARTTLYRGSATTGPASALILREATDATTGSPPATASTTNSFTSPLVIAGTRPSVFFQQRSSTLGALSGLTTVVSELKRADDGALGDAPTVVNSLSGPTISGEQTRIGTVAATDETGAGLVAWGTRVGPIGAANSTVQVARHSASGAWDTPTTVPGLFTTVGVGLMPRLNGLALASTAGNAAQLAYVRDGDLATTRLSSSGAPTAPAPTFVPLAATDSATGTLAATGPGNGDTALVWSVVGSGSASGVQVAYDDVTPPTLTAEATGATVIPGTPAADQAGASRINAELRRRTYHAKGTDLWTPTTITWNFGDGATATGTDPVHEFASAGTKTVTVTATDASGNTTVKTLTDIVPLFDVVAPRLTGATLSTKRFRTATGAARKGKGTVVSFKLNVPAAVELSVVTRVRGYRAAGKGAPCTVSRPKGKVVSRCTTDKIVPTGVRVAGVAGTNKVTFTGRVAGKALKPGKYKLRVGFGGQTTGAVLLPFTIRR